MVDVSSISSSRMLTRSAREKAFDAIAEQRPSRCEIANLLCHPSYLPLDPLKMRNHLLHRRQELPALSALAFSQVGDREGHSVDPL
jgi:hypothetical protein